MASICLGLNVLKAYAQLVIAAVRYSLMKGSENCQFGHKDHINNIRETFAYCFTDRLTEYTSSSYAGIISKYYVKVVKTIEKQG